MLLLMAVVLTKKRFEQIVLGQDLEKYDRVHINSTMIKVVSKVTLEDTPADIVYSYATEQWGGSVIRFGSRHTSLIINS